MSSLAGALDEISPSRPPKIEPSSHVQPSEDVDMNSEPQSPKNESDEEEQDDEEMSDLFGNDNDVEVQRHLRQAPASPTASGPDSERLPSPERERRHALEYEEEDVPPEIAIEVKEAEVRFPNLPVPKSSDGANWVFRVPNYVKVDSKPFHPDTYMGPEHDEEELLQGDSGRERTMTIKLKVENTLRWRWTKDENGQDKRESNARVIRWSDGTLSLRLGKELFDINQSIDTSGSRQTIGGAPPISQSQSQSQSQPTTTPATPGKSQGLVYLVAQHKRSQVLQSEAVITGHMTLRPTGMQSDVHRMLVKAVEQKHNKIAKLRMAPDPQFDPEREKMELIRQSAKKSKKRADDTDGLGRKKRRTARRTLDHDVMWSDDEDDHVGMYGLGSEEEDEDGLSGSPRKAKRKAGAEKTEEEYQADDFVVADSDEDANGAGPSRKRAKEANDVEDELEKMEAKLERQAAAERKGRAGDTKKSKKKADEDEEDTEDEGAGAMDVESEEDEDEEFKVRRVTSKRAIAFDEEEE
ncbi:Leo1-like protein-domain-containing protein [Gymnopilus junonius]|uniref:Leo1-like protein-domain-containing protein n=1 Tax=Gymnopilus junonius TaxID=109634 RepID=A0A9P5NZ18_GYMJU|nr:Leo1-like protein-domain-containing protein [Gymnopilus junonius]